MKQLKVLLLRILQTGNGFFMMTEAVIIHLMLQRNFWINFLISFYYEHPGKKNFGTSYTRNRAVEKSSGEIIAFIDQDDIWYTNRLSVQLEILKQFDDCAMIWDLFILVQEQGICTEGRLQKAKDLNPGLYNPPILWKYFYRISKEIRYQYSFGEKKTF